LVSTIGELVVALLFIAAAGTIVIRLVDSQREAGRRRH
jgi:hypothetical protein